MHTVQIPTSQNITIDYEVAGLGERIMGRIIDLLILSALAIVAFIIWRKLPGTVFAKPDFALKAVLALIIGFYDLICEMAFRGQSIGKRMMNVRVISIDGQTPSFGQYLLRWIFRLVDFLLTAQLAALVCVALSPRKQRIGDIVAGTTVVRTSARTQLDHLAFRPVESDYIPQYPQAASLSEDQVKLIHEVLSNYANSGNAGLLKSMSQQVRQLLSIGVEAGQDDWKFLKRILKDYNFTAYRELL